MTGREQLAEIRWAPDATYDGPRAKAFQLFTWPGDGMVTWPPCTRAAVLRQAKMLKSRGWYVLDTTLALPQKW